MSTRAISDFQQTLRSSLSEKTIGYAATAVRHSGYQSWAESLPSIETIAHHAMQEAIQSLNKTLDPQCKLPSQDMRTFLARLGIKRTEAAYKLGELIQSQAAKIKAMIASRKKSHDEFQAALGKLPKDEQTLLSYAMDLYTATQAAEAAASARKAQISDAQRKADAAAQKAETAAKRAESLVQSVTETLTDSQSQSILGNLEEARKAAGGAIEAAARAKEQAAKLAPQATVEIDIAILSILVSSVENLAEAAEKEAALTQSAVELIQQECTTLRMAKEKASEASKRVLQNLEEVRDIASKVRALEIPTNMPLDYRPQIDEGKSRATEIEQQASKACIQAEKMAQTAARTSDPAEATAAADAAELALKDVEAALQKLKQIHSFITHEIKSVDALRAASLELGTRVLLRGSNQVDSIGDADL